MLVQVLTHRVLEELLNREPLFFEIQLQLYLTLIHLTVFSMVTRVFVGAVSFIVLAIIFRIEGISRIQDWSQLLIDEATNNQTSMNIQANPRWVKYVPAKHIMGIESNSAIETPLNSQAQTSFSETSSGAALSLLTG